MISAVVLAAGQSKRMGQPKMLLPWGKSTVIENIIITILDGGVEDIHIVVGGLKNQIKKNLRYYQLDYIVNDGYLDGEMLKSVQLGIKSLKNETDAALIVLGDQPQIESSTVEAILKRHELSKSQIIVPSYKMKRGHPVLIARQLWTSLLNLKPPMTLRDFMNENSQFIDYLVVDNQSVIQDLDTPDDYFRYKP